MAMDIPRGKAHKRKRAILRVLYSIVSLVALAGITYYLSTLERALPSVERATVWNGVVVRKDLTIKVRGPGTLVPEEEVFISAVTQGRVVRIVEKAGIPVQPDTLILVLSNPELERDALDARLRLEAEQARYRDLEVQQQSQYLTLRATAAQIHADYTQAQMEADSNRQLQEEGLIDELTYQRSKIRAENLKTRKGLEQERLDNLSKAIEAQLDVARVAIDTQRALSELRQSQLEALHVRAGISGQLQEVPVEVGQQVSPGTNLARVARPDRLMAELRIPETQANEIQVNQFAEIDTRNGIIPGHVIRIDPAAQQGVVQVDVALDGPLPQGARPQLSVDGTIQIDKLDNVLVMGRPAYGQADSTIGIFKILPDGVTAARVRVQLGRSSVNEIEVKSGLQEGDQVILSDTSAYDDHDKIRLN